MNLRQHSLIATAVLSLALGACSTGDDAGLEEPAEVPEAEDTDEQATGDEVDDGTETVDVVDNGYEPGQLEVDAGGTVEWTNTGELPHTVTFDDEDSGNLAPDDTYSRTFDEPGEFVYTCTIHPAMEATVTVTD